MNVDQELKEKTKVAEQKARTMTIKEQLEKRFVYSGKNIDALEVAYKQNKSIVLYGKGGYAKSHLCLEYLKLKGQDPYILALGVGSKTEDLFGPINVKEFTENSKFIYNVDDSFMNHNLFNF